jgi:hypothetical protein
MWISILDYSTSTIIINEISDETDVDEYLKEEGYKESTISYMITYDCPYCKINDVDTELDL